MPSHSPPTEKAFGRDTRKRAVHSISPSWPRACPSLSGRALARLRRARIPHFVLIGVTAGSADAPGKPRARRQMERAKESNQPRIGSHGYQSPPPSKTGAWREAACTRAAGAVCCLLFAAICTECVSEFCARLGGPPFVCTRAHSCITSPVLYVCMQHVWRWLAETTDDPMIDATACSECSLPLRQSVLASSCRVRGRVRGRADGARGTP